jgi:hypothetical protein
VFFEFVEPGYRLVVMPLVNLAEYECGVPATMEAGECSTNVVIDKRIVGQSQHGDSMGGAPG